MENKNNPNKFVNEINVKLSVNLSNKALQSAPPWTQQIFVIYKLLYCKLISTVVFYLMANICR